jgi:hypothetical protein
MPKETAGARTLVAGNSLSADSNINSMILEISIDQVGLAQ